MKLLVTPTGPFGYVDPTTGDEIQAFRPSVVRSSPYISTLIGSAKLNLVTNDLSDDANDAEFAQYHKESDRNSELSIASFVSKFGKQKDIEEEQEQKAKEAGLERAVESAKKEAAEKEAVKAKVKAAKTTAQNQE